MKREPGTEDVLFGVMAAGAVLAGAGCLLLRLFDLEWVMEGGPCLILSLTGWYCPGCGGTRAFLALIKGDIAASLRYHPAVLYLAVFGIVFMGWELLHYLSQGRIRRFHYRAVYGYGAAALFILNFIIKNAAQLM